MKIVRGSGGRRMHRLCAMLTGGRDRDRDRDGDADDNDDKDRAWRWRREDAMLTSMRDVDWWWGGRQG